MIRADELPGRALPPIKRIIEDFVRECFTVLADARS